MYAKITFSRESFRDVTFTMKLMATYAGAPCFYKGTQYKIDHHVFETDNNVRNDEIEFRGLLTYFDGLHYKYDRDAPIYVGQMPGNVFEVALHSERLDGTCTRCRGQWACGTVVFCKWTIEMIAEEQLPANWEAGSSPEVSGDPTPNSMQWWEMEL